VADAPPVTEHTKPSRAARLALIDERRAAWPQRYSADQSSTAQALGRLEIRSAVRGAPIPLAVAQERFWFLHQLDPTSPAENVAVALRLDGYLDAVGYSRAWEAILERHEVLRSRFPTTDGRPEQRVGPIVSPVVQVRDFTSMAPVAAERAVLEDATAEADRPFDLARGPVYRLILYRLPGEICIALCSFHHIACDLWSLGVLSHELAAQYSAQCEGRSAELRPLPFHYADYAVSHREWLDGPALVEQFEYWRRQLSGTQVHELPADRPRGSAPGQGATGVVDLPPGLLPAVRTMAGQQGATPFMVLIAAFSYLIARNAPPIARSSQRQTSWCRTSSPPGTTRRCRPIRPNRIATPSEAGSPP